MCIDKAEIVDLRTKNYMTGKQKYAMNFGIFVTSHVCWDYIKEIENG